MTTKKNILGLDLSLTATGVYCDKCGGSVIKTKTRGMERLREIADEVAVHIPHTNIAIIEGYSFGSQGRATFSIGELGGVIKLLMYDFTIPYIDVAPSALKKFATGKGNANKDEVLAAAIRKFNFQGSDNNEADAYILNKIGNAKYNKTIKLTYQQEVLDKIEWGVLNGVS